MPNLNVGLGLAMAATSALAAIDTHFYDEYGAPISTNDGSNSRLSVSSTDDGCAYAGNVVYSCNGGCGLSSFSQKVEIKPNGSYFKSGGGVMALSVYICTAEGRWVECAQNTSSSNRGLKNPLTLHKYNDSGTGYRILDWNYGEDIFTPDGGVDNFCTAPYEAMYDGCRGGIYLNTDCQEIALSTAPAQDGTVQNFYSVCAPGYYLKDLGSSSKQRGKLCTKCEAVTNGTNTTNSWNSASACTLTCNPTYIVSKEMCIPISDSGYNPSNYGGDDCGLDCPDCPPDAVCNGSEVFCRPGEYVWTDWNGNASCASCCGDGPENCRAMAEATAYESTDLCKPNYDWAQGNTDNDCSWTTSAGESPADAGCVAFMGSDDTGNYEYRDKDDKEWHICEYED